MSFNFCINFRNKCFCINIYNFCINLRNEYFCSYKYLELIFNCISTIMPVVCDIAFFYRMH